MAHTGIYIAVEGIDGSGKSSLIKNLAQRLRDANLLVHQTKEPGGSELGKTVRKIVQEQSISILPKAEYLLFAADRAQHIQEVIKPYLHKKYIILSDRCGDSSVVYQGYGRNLDIDMIKTINMWATDNIQPTLTLYVKIDVTEARKRIMKRNETITSFEQEHESFFTTLINGYKTLYENRNDVVQLDGSLSPEELTDTAFEIIMKQIKDE